MSRQIIPISEIQKRHPYKQIFATDREYAAFADKLYDFLHEPLGFMEEQQIRNACVTLALFFEDIHSGTRQFETFTHLHQKMFGRYLPFYDSLSSSDTSAEVDAASFMFWYSSLAERNGKVLNPQNKDVRGYGQKIWNLWLQERDSIRPNEELADYLFSEETQNNALEVKNVLVWLQSRSMFGRWFRNPSVENDPYGIVKGMGNNVPRDFLEYSISNYSAFDHRAWPLSLKAQTIYAEMIRLEMDDENDEMAAEIEQVEAREFGFYDIVKTNKSFVTVRDFNGDTYDISIESFLPGTAQAAKGQKHFLGALFRFQGKWHPNGISVFKTYMKEADKYMKSAKVEYDLKHNHRTQYDSFIEAHGGNRLYFFKDVRQYKEFLRSELGIVHGLEELRLNLPRNKCLMLFLEPCGQATLSAEGACVKHPDNRYYNKAEAEEMGMGFVGNIEFCTPNALLYMIEHDLLPDAMLNDVRGRDFGKRLMQQHMEFLARCMRRDIPTDTPCRRINSSIESTAPQPHLTVDDDAALAARYDSKKSYEEFVALIAEEHSIRSSAGKEWIVVKADHTTTVIRDPRNRTEYSIPTRDLYEAHLALNEKEIQIATVTPFVGKQNASAASALLYTIVGRGQMMSMLRKMVRSWL